VRFKLQERFTDLTSHCKYKKPNGIDGKGYLEKVRAMFEEMGLEKDLDNLKRIMSYV